MTGTATSGLSRREFLAGASALGGVAIASAAASAQITTIGALREVAAVRQQHASRGRQTAARVERQ